MRMVHHNEPPEPSASSHDRVRLSTELPCPPRLATQTHLRPFRDPAERSLVTQTIRYLCNSGFYWGPLDVDEAHARLASLPTGTFLIRDSMQTDVFFTLSYCADEGPTSVRVLLSDGGFALDGSKHTFLCLFQLLEFYMSSSKRSLKRPYRGGSPQKLQELCRTAVVRTHGKENIERLGVSAVLKDFMHSYPFGI